MHNFVIFDALLVMFYEFLWVALDVSWGVF